MPSSTDEPAQRGPDCIVLSLRLRTSYGQIGRTTNISGLAFPQARQGRHRAFRLSLYTFGDPVSLWNDGGNRK